MRGLLLALCTILLATRPIAAADPCATSPLLPAYSHNDELQPAPFAAALAAGAQGVEVDLFRAGSVLLVGHDRGQLRSDRVFARMYLRAMTDHVRECGHVLAGGAPFLLLLELKEADEAGFDLLLSELAEFEQELFTPGHAAVVLVGWWPANPANQARWPSYITVQLEYPSPRREEKLGVGAGGNGAAWSAPIGMVSVDFGRVIRWDGRSATPARAKARLNEARGLADSLGVPLRVHQAPPIARVYSWLIEGGVELIGLKRFPSESRLLPPDSRAMRR